MNKPKLIRIVACWVIVSLLAGRVGFYLGQTSERKWGKQLDLSMMWEVKSRLEESYLDKASLDDKKMTEGAIGGLVSSLDDPYTVYLPPEDNKRTREDLSGKFGGVGIVLGYKDRTLAVMSVLKATPADEVGIKAGDLILHIKDSAKAVDRDTGGVSLPQAVELIRGPVGSEVELTIFHEGDSKEKSYTVVRQTIVVPNLELEWREGNGKHIAVVKLQSFTEKLFEDWPALVQRIVGEKPLLDGIVLDLRNNSGGFLQGSVMVASDFLAKGIVVKQEMSGGVTESYPVEPGRQNFLDTPLLILVNHGSASASEILAGALQELGRAKLVGVKTFGKGTVQQPESLKDGAGLHITIARWLLPSGKNIHKEGVEPDVVVEEVGSVDTDVQLEKAIEMLTNS